eukprot:284569-Hanusia_phi.AAC.1
MNEGEGGEGVRGESTDCKAKGGRKWERREGEGEGEEDRTGGRESRKVEELSTKRGQQERDKTAIARIAFPPCHPASAV